jgi:hypothetical protein
VPHISILRCGIEPISTESFFLLGASTQGFPEFDRVQDSARFGDF